MEFGRRYDLHGSGLKYREEEDRKKIMVLQDELILLETGTHERGRGTLHTHITQYFREC